MPDHFYVYPAYLDRSGSRTDGRRVAASDAASEVTAERIVEVARRLGFAAEVEAEKEYPRQAHRYAGRVKVTKKKGVTKVESLRRIARALRESAPPSPGG